MSSSANTEPSRFTVGPNGEHVCAKCQRAFGSVQAVRAHYGRTHETVPRGRRGPKVKKVTNDRAANAVAKDAL